MNTVTRGAYVAAPLLLLAGVCALKFGWRPNPDLDWSVAFPLWTIAHLVYLAGFLGFGVVLADLWRRTRVGEASRRAMVDVLAATGVVGLVAMTGQLLIDLLAGFRAENRAGMSALFRSYQDIPGVDAFFYGLVPMLLLVAVSALIVLLAVRRQVAALPAAVFVAGMVATGTGGTAAMVTGGVLACVTLPALRPGRSAAKIHSTLVR